MRQLEQGFAGVGAGSSKTQNTSGFIAVGEGHELHYIRAGKQGGNPDDCLSRRARSLVG